MNRISNFVRNIIPSASGVRNVFSRITSAINPMPAINEFNTMFTGAIDIPVSIDATGEDFVPSVNTILTKSNADNVGKKYTEFILSLNNKEYNETIIKEFTKADLLFTFGTSSKKDYIEKYLVFKGIKNPKNLKINYMDQFIKSIGISEVQYQKYFVKINDYIMDSFKSYNHKVHHVPVPIPLGGVSGTAQEISNYVLNKYRSQPVKKGTTVYKAEFKYFAYNNEKHEMLLKLTGVHKLYHSQSIKQLSNYIKDIFWGSRGLQSPFDYLWNFKIEKLDFISEVDEVNDKEIKLKSATVPPKPWNTAPKGGARFGTQKKEKAVPKGKRSRVGQGPFINEPESNPEAASRNRAILAQIRSRSSPVDLLRQSVAATDVRLRSSDTLKLEGMPIALFEVNEEDKNRCTSVAISYAIGGVIGNRKKYIKNKIKNIDSEGRSINELHPIFDNPEENKHIGYCVFDEDMNIIQQYVPNSTERSRYYNTCYFIAESGHMFAIDKDAYREIHSHLSQLNRLKKYVPYKNEKMASVKKLEDAEFTIDISTYKTYKEVIDAIEEYKIDHKLDYEYLKIKSELNPSYEGSDNDLFYDKFAIVSESPEVTHYIYTDYLKTHNSKPSLRDTRVSMGCVVEFRPENGPCFYTFTNRQKHDVIKKKFNIDMETNYSIGNLAKLIFCDIQNNYQVWHEQANSLNSTSFSNECVDFIPKYPVENKTKPFTEEQKKKAKERDNYTCQKCGETMIKIDIDHHIATHKGGLSLDKNSRTLCIKCNRGLKDGPDDYHFKELTSDLSNENIRNAFVNGPLKPKEAYCNEFEDDEYCVSYDISKCYSDILERGPYNRWHHFGIYAEIKDWESDYIPDRIESGMYKIRYLEDYPTLMQVGINEWVSDDAIIYLRDMGYKFVIEQYILCDNKIIEPDHFRYFVKIIYDKFEDEKFAKILVNCFIGMLRKHSKIEKTKFKVGDTTEMGKLKAKGCDDWAQRFLFKAENDQEYWLSWKSTKSDFIHTAVPIGSQIVTLAKIKLHHTLVKMNLPIGTPIGLHTDEIVVPLDCKIQVDKNISYLISESKKRGYIKPATIKYMKSKKTTSREAYNKLIKYMDEEDKEFEYDCILDSNNQDAIVDTIESTKIIETMPEPKIQEIEVKDDEIEHYKWKNKFVEGEGYSNTELIDIAIEIIERKESLFIAGEGGCGKTFLAKLIYKHCKNKSEKNWHIMKMTSTNDRAKRIGGMTISRFAVQNNIEEKPQFCINKKDHMLCIQDEIGQVDEENMTTIVQLKRNYECVILATGDPGQLKPVNGEMPIGKELFTWLVDGNMIVLTENRRSEELVKENGKKIRAGEDIDIQQLKDFRTDIKYFCYQNAVRYEINKIISEKIIKEREISYYKTTSLESMPYIFRGMHIVAKVNKGERYTNSQEGYICGMKGNMISVIIRIPENELDGIPEYTQKIRIYIDTLLEQFDTGYVCTIHKSQGRTLDEEYCIVNYDSLPTDLKYTSYSRTKYHKKVFKI